MSDVTRNVKEYNDEAPVGQRIGKRLINKLVEYKIDLSKHSRQKIASKEDTGLSTHETITRDDIPEGSWLTVELDWIYGDEHVVIYRHETRVENLKELAIRLVNDHEYKLQVKAEANKKLIDERAYYERLKKKFEKGK